MPFRQNYDQQRGDRNRAKQQKTQDRLQRREAEALKRKAEREADPAATPPAPAEPEE